MKEYIEEIRMLAGVGSGGVSVQRLGMLREKYNLTDEQMDEIQEYCAEHWISVYDEDIIAVNIEAMSKQVPAAPPRKKEKSEYDMLIDTVVDIVMRKAIAIALKRKSRRGWICGNHTDVVRSTLANTVRRNFSADELRFIAGHVSASDQDDSPFSMADSSDQALCDTLNDRLNEIIPGIHVNSFASDFLRDE